MLTRSSQKNFLCVLLLAAIMPLAARPLTLREDAASGTISILRAGEAKPILIQHAGAEQRPYLHPLVAPDGKGVLTEVGPAPHQHETGIFWGITSLNGRNYFENPGAGFWKRVSITTLIAQGEEVKWSTAYHLLDAAGKPL